MNQPLKYWLFKTEPESFSSDDLRRAPRKTTYWDGVRNYQARNFLRDDVHVGDLVLIYHSNAEPPAVAGLAEVVRAGYPDFTAWDPKSDHPDPASTAENPRWYMVDIRWRETFARPLPLAELKAQKKLAGLELLRTGSRLSIQPVSAAHFEIIVQLAHAK